MRNIPGEAQSHFKRLTKEILKYGNEGKRELDALFEVMPPKKIFSLPSGPVRGAKEAELIGEMRVIARDFAEEKARASRPKKEVEPKKVKKVKAAKPKRPPEPKIVRRSSGNVDRFSYIIVELDNGDIRAKINRKGRNIFEHEDAPKIYESNRLKRAFKDKDEAEFEVRRVVNSAMVWYETRGIRPREKVRRSKDAGRGIGRRTPEMKSAISRERRETRDIKRKKRAAKDRKSRLLEEKVRRSNPTGKTIGHIPRVNPSNPSSFRHSEDTAEKQAVKAFAAYVKYKDKWDESNKKGRPRFDWVMKSYDAIENARANFLLSGNMEQAAAADKIKAGLRTKINDLFADCIKRLASKKDPETNPTPEVHGEIGRSTLTAADRSIAKYEGSGKLKDLLDAHDGYTTAFLELKRGWASPRKDRATIDEIRVAKEGVNETRRIILKKMKG